MEPTAPSHIPGKTLFTVQEISKILKVSPEWVIRHFATRSGVLNFGSEEIISNHKKKSKRQYRVLRIPRWVLHKFLSEHGGMQ
jgi:hypothetical protein